MNSCVCRAAASDELVECIRPSSLQQAETHDTERSGEFQIEVGLSILALPRSDRSQTSSIPGKRYWAPIGQLLTIGILSPRVHHQLRCRVDAEARDADFSKGECLRISTLLKTRIEAGTAKELSRGVYTAVWPEKELHGGG